MRKKSSQAKGRRKSSYSAVEGLRLALAQTANLTSHAVGVEGIEEEEDIENKIRKAKQEMRTITVLNGCLYIDYKFVGDIPDGLTVQI